MLLRPYLRLALARLVVGAVGSLLFVMLLHMIVSSDNPADLGVFWHHFCGCPADSRDAGILLAAPNFLVIILAIGMSLNPGTVALPGQQNERRFLLTRPVSRLAIQFVPWAFSFAVFALFPAIFLLLLLGWLQLVHAPSLAHLVAVAELVPSAANLGPHPSLPQLASALHVGRRYLAAISVGLAVDAIFSAQRWFAISPRKPVRVAAALMGLLYFLPTLLLRSRSFFSDFLFVADKHHLDYLPSPLGIGVCLAIAALFLAVTAFTLREVEL